MKSDQTSGLAKHALVLGISALFGCTPEPPEAPRQAILLLLDAGRPDRFSCYGYDRATTPEMDRLADNGIVFRRHFAQATYTRRSVSSLMYSRYYCLPLFPASSQVPLEDPSDLFRRSDDTQISFVRALHSAGFKTAAISAHLWTAEGTTFANEFDEMHDLATRLKSSKETYPRAKKVIDYTIDWIRKNKERDYFLYVHLMDMHNPHYFDSDAKGYFGSSTYDTRRMRLPAAQMSEEDRRFVNALYDGSMRYADRHVGRLLEFLRAEGLWETTAIVVTADHGEFVLDPPTRQLFAHGGAWFDPVAKIPLIIHYPPKLTRTEFDNFSENVDIAPTLLALLDVPVPDDKQLDGVNLLAVINGNASARDSVVARSGIRTNQYKCLFETDDALLLGTTLPEVQALSGILFDLVADPQETTNVFSSKPEVVTDMLERYRSRMASSFRRYETARSTEQPRSAFAISARHMATVVPLQTLPYAVLSAGLERTKSLSDVNRLNGPDGWQRYRVGSRSALASFNTDQPLSVHFPLPNGTYDLTAKMTGHAIIAVDGQELEVTAGPITELGTITVRDEVFRATIRPQRSLVALNFFGFIPETAGHEDPMDAENRLRRLKSLGYVGD